MNAQIYRTGTKNRVIADLVVRDLTRREIFAELRPMVISQTAPMVFTRNVPGSKREALPMHKQVQRLWDQIGRIQSAMTGTEYKREEMPQTDEEPKPEPRIDTRDEDAENYFLRRVEEIRTFCQSRAEIGEPLDEISIRPMRDGIRAIRQGITADAMLNTMTIHWPQDARDAAGIPKVNFVTESAKLAKQYKLGEGWHKMAGFVIALAEARVPVMLVGPAGSGKSHLAKQLADYLEMTYAECPLTAGATPSWLLGSWNIKEYVTRPHLTQFEHGGVFNYEEIDAADPNMLLVMNQALASDEFFNPVNGEMYSKSDDFIPVSTANTFGLGATRAFTARERLDAATIDRWRMGRVFVEVDTDLARWVALNQ